jgi:hypothetical protein
MLALCAAVAAVADEAPATVAMEELAMRLNLSAGQQAQIAPALEERNSRLRALRGEFDVGASRRQKLRALREARSIQQDFVGKVSPVLTSGQKAEWDKLRDEMREKLRERRDGRD